jgi:hypothetical protein
MIQERQRESSSFPDRQGSSYAIHADGKRPNRRSGNVQRPGGMQAAGTDDPRRVFDAKAVGEKLRAVKIDFSIWRGTKQVANRILYVLMSMIGAGRRQRIRR